MGLGLRVAGAALRAHRSEARRLQRSSAMSALLSRKASAATCVAAFALLSACGGATRAPATPQKTGTAELTSAKVAPRIERVLVADRGVVAMVARDGCVATVSIAELEAGATDELRIRCPRPDRLAGWFEGIEALTTTVAFEEVDEEEESEDIDLPAAEVITARGSVRRATKKADTERLLAEVRALTAELAAAEVPAPGPSSDAGWQMLRVSGPAHVFFAGEPATGVLDARVSTTGQYYCEFLAHTSEGPMRATKSGWISPNVASRAIDEVLVPFVGLSESERPHPTYAAGIASGKERMASSAATAAVFERFAPVQEALGDACLPELDAPEVGATTL